MLEKAYAKLHGSYEAIEGGFVHFGLVDLTSGTASSEDLEAQRVSIHSGNLWGRMLELYSHGHLLGAGSPAGSDKDVSSLGIVQGHAYR